MGRTWILHTATKGTGAQMVPLESATKRSSTVEPVLVPRTPPRSPEPSAPKPRPTHRFMVVDVMTRQVLVDGASTREAIEVLKETRSVVDVNVYVWHEEHDRWRLLTFGEERVMWDLSRSDPGPGLGDTSARSAAG